MVIHDGHRAARRAARHRRRACASSSSPPRSRAVAARPGVRGAERRLTRAGGGRLGRGPGLAGGLRHGFAVPDADSHTTAARRAHQEAPDARVLRRRFAGRPARHPLRAARLEERAHEGAHRLPGLVAPHQPRPRQLALAPRGATARRSPRGRDLHDRRERHRHADAVRGRVHDVPGQEMARGVRTPRQEDREDHAAERRRSVCTGWACR